MCTASEKDNRRPDSICRICGFSMFSFDAPASFQNCFQRKTSTPSHTAGIVAMPPDQFVVCMGVNIQRHADVGMPHEILKAFNVDAGLLHICAESVAQHMWG